MGSFVSRLPGMSFHRKFWKVRTLVTSYFEKTVKPNLPPNSPKPKASLPKAPSPGVVSTTPLLSRSKPDARPVFVVGV